MVSSSRGLLILGGITEARIITEKILKSFRPVWKGPCFYALAGLNDTPLSPEGAELVSGGFGGVSGLENFLKQHNIGAVINATHPFTKRIGEHAQLACRTLNLPLLRFLRPSWQPDDAEHVIPFANANHVARWAQNQTTCRRFFLALGKSDFSSFADMPFAQEEETFFLLRTVTFFKKPPPFKYFYHVLARGPFQREAELHLLKQHRIEAIIARNSDISGSQLKASIAKEMQVPFLMIMPPSIPEKKQKNLVFCDDMADAVRWVEDFF